MDRPLSEVLIDNASGRSTNPLAVRLWGGLLILLATSAYCVVWIWQGLDITDEGFNATRHLLISNSSPHYQYGMIWFSDWVGGVWLKLIGDPGLIGVRLGWVLVHAITTLVAYWVISAFFQPLPSFLATAATAIMVIYHGTLIISYNNVPALLMVGACGLILASQYAQRAMPWRLIAAIAAGILLGLSVMGRFPNVLAVALPLIPPLVQSCIARRRIALSWLVAAATAVSIAVALVLCLACLHAAGRLEEYMGVFFVARGESHGLKALLLGYIKDAAGALEHVLALVFWLAVLAVAIRAAFSRAGLKKAAKVGGAIQPSRLT